MEEINEQFNKELQQQIDEVLPKGHIYKLGKPNEILFIAGMPDLPIEMTAGRLMHKSNQENHPFKLSEVKNLHKVICNPLAIFRSATHIGSIVILTTLRQGEKNFVVVIETNSKKSKAFVNSIRSIHPRTTSNILNWINDGLMDYVDKERMSEWVENKKKMSRNIFGSTPANAILQLKSATKIIQNFKNPIIFSP